MAPRYKVEVAVTLKVGVPDMKGQEVFGGLRSLGAAEGVIRVQTGKLIELDIEHTATDRSIDEVVRDMCKQLLVHPVIEVGTYRITLYRNADDIWQIDLTGKWPDIGPYRVLRAEWKLPETNFSLIRYAKKGVEQRLGWRLDLDKTAIIDDVESDIGPRRGTKLRKFIPEMTDYIIDYRHMYGDLNQTAWKSCE